MWKGVAGVCWRTAGDGWWFFANVPVWKSFRCGFTGKGEGSEVQVNCSCWLTWVAA